MNRLTKDLLCFGLPWVIIFGLFFYQAHRNSQKAFADFVAWMRRHHYAEQFVHIYQCNARDPALKLVIDDYLKIRAGDLRIPADSRAGYEAFKNADAVPLTFIEVIPSDRGAQFEKVDPAVLERFRVYLEERFGKTIRVDHKEIYKDYKHDIGDIFYSYDAMFIPKTNQRLLDFVEEFPAPCMVRFDAEKLDGRDVAVIAEIRHCTMIMGQYLRLADNINVFDQYAHEFGHIVGLDHQFVDSSNIPRSRSWFVPELMKKNIGKRLGIDDIMIEHSPVVNPAEGRYLSPLSRYVLEPVQGYQDGDRLGQEYSRIFDERTVRKFENMSCGGR